MCELVVGVLIVIAVGTHEAVEAARRLLVPGLPEAALR